MKSEFESRETFECIFGGEDGIDLSKDETGEYSFQPSRFAYSFFLVAWQYRQTEVDALTLQVAEMKSRLNDAYTDGQSAMYAARQSKVDELQKKNAWLSDVAERENKRANKLQEEKVSTTSLLGKTIQEKNDLQRRNQMLNDNIKEQGQKLVYQNEVIETQAEKLLCLRDEKAELQKRVDELHTAFKQLIEMENESISFEHDLFDN